MIAFAAGAHLCSSHTAALAFELHASEETYLPYVIKVRALDYNVKLKFVEIEKAKRKKEKMVKRLKKMEEKMVVGDQALVIAKSQKNELKKTRKEQNLLQTN